MATLNPGVIYELREDVEEHPEGSRWEFIGGPDDDVFSDGSQYTYFASDEILRSPNQDPLEYSRSMQVIKSRCLAGLHPEFN